MRPPLPARPRDSPWFAAIYESHYPAVHAYVARRSFHHADDVTAEVFCVAWRKRDEVPEHVLPWLYGVARHHLLHAYRSSERRQSLVGRLAATLARRHGSDDATAQVDERHDAHSLALRILAGLSERDAEILRLAAWEDLTAQDIAQVLGCSSASARVRLHRARTRAAHLAHLLADAPAPPSIPTSTSQEMTS